LEKLINTAQRTRKADGSFLLSWGTDELKVSVGLRIVSSAQAQAANAGGPRTALGGQLPQQVAGIDAEAPSESPSPARSGVASVVMK
ncbi:MAG: hypothetical protein M0P63_19910, partial [Azoarcus sp.]|nr:hypothetical protein [Azoarcus sp.]